MSTQIIFDTSALVNLANYVLLPKYVPKGENTAKLIEKCDNNGFSGFLNKQKLPIAHKFLMGQYNNENIFDPHITGLTLIEILTSLNLPMILPENILIETMGCNARLEKTRNFFDNKTEKYKKIANDFLDPNINAREQQQKILRDSYSDSPTINDGFEKLERVAIQQFNFRNHLLPMLERNNNLMIRAFIARDNGLSRALNDAMYCLYASKNFTTTSTLNENDLTLVKKAFTEIKVQEPRNATEDNFFFKKIPKIVGKYTRSKDINYGELGISEAIEHYRTNDKKNGFIYVITDDARYSDKATEESIEKSDNKPVICISTRAFIQIMYDTNIAKEMGVIINPDHYVALLKKPGFTFDPKIPFKPLKKDGYGYKHFLELIQSCKTREKEGNQRY